MRVNADEYRKFQKAPNFNDFSRDCYNLFAIEKRQEMKTLIRAKLCHPDPEAY